MFYFSSIAKPFPNRYWVYNIFGCKGNNFFRNNKIVNLFQNFVVPPKDNQIFLYFCKKLLFLYIKGKAEKIHFLNILIMLQIGDKLPLITLVDQYGNPFNTRQIIGKKTVLYFYPKDNTSGCTAEACSLNESFDKWIKARYQIVGVSPDSPTSHQKFIAKYNLQFTLLADTEKELATAFGVWGEKSMYGRKYMGIMRTTFVINEQGIITRVVEKVNTKEHSQQLFELLNISN
jgi:peroxiredoxin Q/BCP